MNRSKPRTLHRILTAVLALGFWLQISLPLQAQPSTNAPQHAQQSVFMLRDAIKNGKVTLKIQGDGVTTSHIRVLITSRADSDVVILIPRFEIFHPGLSAGFQKMMATTDSMAVVPAGRTIDFEIPTVCADVKTVPPPNGQSEFTVGPYGTTEEDMKAWKELAATVLAASDLGKKETYNNLPIGAALDKTSQVMQLAIWRLLGIKSGNTANSVTSEAIQKDFLDAMSEAAKKNPDLLKQLTAGGAKLSANGELIPSKEQKKKTADTSDAIFAAIDLTLRRSEEPTLASTVVVPKTSWDGYYDVGIRAFGGGDFTEAGELLEAAVAEAETFGEADDRLSLSLVGMGECYSDFGNLTAAEPIFTRALTLREKVHGKDSVEVAVVDNDLGVLKQRMDSFEKAEDFFTKALNIATKAASSTGNLVAKVLNNLGRNFCLKKDGAAAVSKLQQAMVLTLENSKNEKTAAVAEIDANLANAYAQSGNAEKAGKFYDEALSIAMAQLGENHPLVATILLGQADLAAQQDNQAAAEAYRKKAEQIDQTSFKDFSKSLASYPASYDALTRYQLYCAGCKQLNVNKDKILKEAESLKGQSLNKAQVDRKVADKWALVIGVSKYKDPTINLKYSSKDAQDFAKFLTTDAHFAPDHVHVLLDEQATVTNIKAELGDKFLPRAAHEDDLVVIYLSGHGSPSSVDLQGANFFVAYDTDKNNLYATGLGMNEITNIIKTRLHCDRAVVMLDACHSGAISLGAKALFRVHNFDAGGISQGSGKLVICSSEPEEVSWESKRYPNGVFTHYLIDGFRKQGVDTKLKDAFDFVHDGVYDEVLRDRGETQRPMIKSRWDGSDLVLCVEPAKPRPGMPQETNVSQSSPAPSTASAKSVTPGSSKPNTAKATGAAQLHQQRPLKPAGTTPH